MGIARVAKSHDAFIARPRRTGRTGLGGRAQKEDDWTAGHGLVQLEPARLPPPHRAAGAHTGDCPEQLWTAAARVHADRPGRLLASTQSQPIDRRTRSRPPALSRRDEGPLYQAALAWIQTRTLYLRGALHLSAPSWRARK